METLMEAVMRIHHNSVLSFLDVNNDIYTVRDVCKSWRKFSQKRWNKREVIFLFRSCLNVPGDNISIKDVCIGIDIAAREYINLPPSPATIHGLIYNQTQVACINGKHLVVLAHTNSGLYVLRLKNEGKLRQWCVPQSPAKVLNINSCSCIKNCKCSNRCSPPLRLSTMGYAVATYQDRLFLVGGTSSFNGGGEVPSPYIWEYSLERNEIWRFAALREPRIDPSAHIVKDSKNRRLLVVLGGYGRRTMDQQELSSVDAIYLDTGKRVLDMPDFPFLEVSYEADPQNSLSSPERRHEVDNQRPHPENYQGYSDIKWGTNTVQLGNKIILPWSPCRVDDAAFPVLDPTKKIWKEVNGTKFPSSKCGLDYWPLPRIVNGSLTLFLKANKILISPSNYWAQDKSVTYAQAQALKDKKRSLTQLHYESYSTKNPRSEEANSSENKKRRVWTWWNARSSEKSILGHTYGASIVEVVPVQCFS